MAAGPSTSTTVDAGSWEPGTDYCLRLRWTSGIPSIDTDWIGVKKGVQAVATPWLEPTPYEAIPHAH